MLNSRDRSGEKLHAHLEADAARRRDEMHRASETASGQRDRFEAEQQRRLEAIHAEYVAAEARQRNPSVFSRQGAIAALYLLALTGGIFLLANLAKSVFGN